MFISIDIWYQKINYFLNMNKYSETVLLKQRFK